MKNDNFVVLILYYKKWQPNVSVLTKLLYIVYLLVK